MAQTEFAEETQVKTKLQKPKKYAVFILNDDYTPMDFVIVTLMKFFNMGQMQAQAITERVHVVGEGLCGIYTKEIAEMKVAESNDFAKANKHPLRTVMRSVD